MALQLRLVYVYGDCGHVLCILDSINIYDYNN